MEKNICDHQDKGVKQIIGTMAISESNHKIAHRQTKHELDEVRREISMSAQKVEKTILREIHKLQNRSLKDRFEEAENDRVPLNVITSSVTD